MKKLNKPYFLLIAVSLIYFCQSNLAVASGNQKTQIKVHSHSCKAAYAAARNSPSTGTVAVSTDVCTKAAEAACTNYVEKNSDGPDTGDGRYIAASCELMAAYGANKSVNNGKASPKCEAAYQQATNSPSTGDVAVASDTCTTEKQSACDAKVAQESDGQDTGDGRYVAASCELTAAYGAYLEVSKKK